MYKRMPGSARHYIDLVTGEEITYRTYRNRAATSAGFTSYSHYQRVLRSDRGYQKILANARDTLPTPLDIHSPATALYAQALRERTTMDRDYVMRASGPLAAFLVSIGLRDVSASYDVGDTPKHGGYDGGSSQGTGHGPYSGGYQ